MTRHSKVRWLGLATCTVMGVAIAVYYVRSSYVLPEDRTAPRSTTGHQKPVAVDAPRVHEETAKQLPTLSTLRPGKEIGREIKPLATVE
jgi:hypothetical protein